MTRVEKGNKGEKKGKKHGEKGRRVSGPILERVVDRGDQRKKKRGPEKNGGELRPQYFRARDRGKKKKGREKGGKKTLRGGEGKTQGGRHFPPTGNSAAGENGNAVLGLKKFATGEREKREKKKGRGRSVQPTIVRCPWTVPRWTLQ